MKTIGAREFNRHTSQVLRQVLRTAEPVAITYQGRPRIAVLPVGRELTALERLALAGRATVPDRGRALPDLAFDPAGGVDAALGAVREER
ncbi:MAG: type II toxin-antitoxin system Phd/YefM family antitoxin [Bifidobacteriaceae bacterium]|jgi:prevent-host-death family protein|nr:type II toxin-antitoxin system Phd/YefM family antitoxin [Bifidobacteriaceae bacterium]